MKWIFLGLIYILFAQHTSGQQNVSQQDVQQDHISVFFNEIKYATQKHSALWNKNLYGAILLVNAQDRTVFANESDEKGSLKPKGSIFVGTLPETQNIANTAVTWNGKHWAMLQLPLASIPKDRINLLAHELFHKAQPSLGFIFNEVSNSHLDQREGRIYLRLELEALKKAIQATSKRIMLQHLTHALTFRKYRYLLYAGSEQIENHLELNEGIAEFTGLIISDRNRSETILYAIKGIRSLYESPTFVRSFAYHTTPIYGYLLYQYDKTWQQKITTSSNLADNFIQAFALKIPDNLKESTLNFAPQYHGEIIFQEERAREERGKILLATYKRQFVEQPHFEIAFEQMNVSFNPNNLVPLENYGTVYPNLRISDTWGILTVERGAMIGQNWDKVCLTNPRQIEAKIVSGDGWTLELQQGYRVEKDQSSGHYKLLKNK